VNAKPGDVAEGELKATGRLVRAVWGHLPEKMRDEMEQAFGEKELPKYRAMIERYFRTIAEEGQTPSR
jgi:hypothetical protein